MNSIWVYGCSFSEPFGLLPINDGQSILENGLRDFFGVDYWGTHLSKKMGYNCISKGLSGIGWNYITHLIDNDILKWQKDDIIIISPSFLNRVTIMEFTNGSTREELFGYYKNWVDITQYNEIRWRTKIKTLQHFGYNVYTWVVDSASNNIDEIKNLILSPGGFTNWKEWMDLHKEYWIDPTFNKYPEGDWHFNPLGHVAVADAMYDFIISQKEV